MPKPIIGPCGGVGQPPCPPVPATEPKEPEKIKVPQIPGTTFDLNTGKTIRPHPPTGDDGPQVDVLERLP